ncbi:histidine utilization repressor [Jiella endophytica]|uniref:Histidine utilization repressor n=1 Tax=Jiella endophytica TaxID=2558362 RepID=A0A4Y8RU63_9HYPH|nr:histidine utilization repressor [Jiella endophytica]TFF27865.1 histidine utilization repressor [Jiella endophytica]
MIRDDLEAKILSREWPPGAQIPFEADLATRYGCSRMTVNKVLTQLVQAGLIERRRKAGSFVRRPQSHSAVLEIVDIRREVEALGLAYHFEILRSEIRPAAADDAERLALPAGATLLAITCRHFAARQPFCLEERIISLDAVPEAGETDFADISPGAWLVARIPWSNAEHRIRAAAAAPSEAASLLIEAGAPCLVIERRTWDQARPITHVRLTYPGDGHEVVAHFAPTGA